MAIAGLSACALLDPRSPEEIVKERAQARWDALVKYDTKTAYSYFSPGSRAVLNLAGYESTLRRGFWKSAVVNKAECESAQKCDAILTIEYEHQGMRVKTPLRETWVREGSNWWYLHK